MRVSLNKYELLLEEANCEYIQVIQYNFDSPNLKALYCDGYIALNNAITTTVEKTCLIAEELGHFHTSVGDILDQSTLENRRQEHTAKKWAAQKLITFDEIIKASQQGVCNKYELADFLEVTEDFVERSLQYLQQQYGLFYKTGKYIIFFDPLRVKNQNR